MKFFHFFCINADLLQQNPKKIKKIREAIGGSVNTQKEDKALQNSLEKDVNEFLTKKDIIPQIEFKSCLERVSKLYNDKDAWKLHLQSKSKAIRLYVLKDHVSPICIISDNLSQKLSSGIVRFKSEMFLPKGDIQKIHRLFFHELLFDKYMPYCTATIIQEHSKDHLDCYTIYKLPKPFSDRDSVFTKIAEVSENAVNCVSWSINHPDYPPKKNYIRAVVRGKVKLYEINFFRVWIFSATSPRRC